MEAMSWIDNVEYNWQAASDLTANDVHCARTLFICNAKLQASYRHDECAYDTLHNKYNVISYHNRDYTIFINDDIITIPGCNILLFFYIELARK